MKRIFILTVILLSFLTANAQTPPAKFKYGINTEFTQYQTLTTTEMNALSFGAGDRVVIFNITDGKYKIWNGSAWVNLVDVGIADLSDDYTTFDSNASRFTISHGNNINLYAPSLTIPNNTVNDSGGTIVGFVGTYNATTNDPTLANTDTDVKGLEYVVTTVGTQDFGAGNIIFGVGDIVSNDGSVWFKKVDNNQMGIGGSDDQTAAEVPFSPYLTITSPDTQGAIEELKDEFDGISVSGGDITKVLNVAALRNFTVAPADKSLFYLEGYNTRHDGGQGFVRWENTSTDTDDGGSIYKATTITTGRFVRLFPFYGVDIRHFGATNEDVDSTDDTVAFNNASAYARGVANGEVINIMDGQYRITPNHTSNTFDWSDITIRGNGSVLVEDANVPLGVTVGRGNLLTFDADTTNFVWDGVDVEVESGTEMNNFMLGIFVSIEGGLDQIHFRNMEVSTQSEADTSKGVTGWNFFRDETDDLDTDTNGTITFTNIVGRFYGKEMYGIRFIRETTNIVMENVELTGSAYTDDFNASFNGIAIYDSSTLTGNNIRLYNWGHSLLALSMAKACLVTNLRLEGNSITGEAGLEIEYKDVHGRDDFQTEDIVIQNIIAKDLMNAIFITERDDSATTLAPQNIIIDGAIINNSENIDVMVSSTITDANDLTSEISNVLLKGIKAKSDSASAGLFITNGSGITAKDCTFDGQAINLQIGKDSTIYTTGTVRIDGCEFYNATNQATLVSSLGGVLIYNDNEHYSMGLRAFQSTLPVQSNAKLIVTNNYAEGNDTASEGFRISNNAGSLLLSRFMGNTAKDFTGKGHNVALNSSFMNYNIAESCGTASTYTGTNNTPNLEN